MRTLHILKTPPDETVEALRTPFADQPEKMVALYEGEVDWEALIDDIFAAETVICWW